MQKLLTKENTKDLSKYPLYSQDGKSFDAIVSVKFFSPKTGWRWYITEADLEEGTAFGYVCGFEQEMGYISFEELEANMADGSIERDIYFSPKGLGQALTADGYAF